MKAQKFELKTPLLTAGRSTAALPETSRTRISLKFLAEGGEEGLHSHTYEDQTYLVLDGEATFYDGNEAPTVVRCGEGILMPAGTQYRFVTTGAGPAVVLRIGGTTADGWAHYLDGNGDPLVLNPGMPRAVQADGQFWTLNGVSKE